MTRKQPLTPQFRRLWPGEAGAVADHLLGLSAADRQLRFGRPVDDTFVHAYCERIDWFADVVIGAFTDGGRLHGVGILSLMGWDLPLSAAAALSVDGASQHQGLGAEILHRLLLAARNRFIQRVFVLCQAENRPMRRLAERFGGLAEEVGGEVESLIELGPPTPFSLAFEALSHTALPTLASFEPCRTPLPEQWKKKDAR